MNRVDPDSKIYLSFRYRFYVCGSTLGLKFDVATDGRAPPPSSGDMIDVPLC